MLKILCTIRTVFITVIFAAFLTACGSDSSSSDDDNSGGNGDGNGNGDGSGSGLSFLIKTDAGQAIKDVSVSLYNSDNKTIAQTVLTGDDGIASLSNATTSLKTSTKLAGGSTVTVAYNNPDSGNLEIETYYELANKAYTLIVDAENCTPQATINITYNNHTGTSVGALLFPFSPFGNLGSGASGSSTPSPIQQGGTINYNSVDVCPEHIQSDGTISHLSIGFNNAFEVDSYGFELDQPLINNGDYTGTAGIAPSSVNWNTATGSKIPELMSLGAVRKNVLMQNLGIKQIEDPDQSGTIQVASTFPGDSYYSFAATGQEADEQCFVIQTISDLSSDVSIQFTDHSFSDLQYDDTSKQFSWTRNGSDSSDLQNLNLDFDSEDVDWEFTMPPTVSSVVLPDLPPAIEALFNRGNLALDDTSVDVMSVASIEGYDALIDKILAENSEQLEAFYTASTFSVCSQEGFAGDTSGGGGGGGGGSGGAGITLSGDGLSQSSTSTFELANAQESNNGIPVILFTATDGATISVFVSPSGTEALQVSFTDSAQSNTWRAVSDTGVVAGVMVQANKVIFSNTELEKDDGSKVIIDGEMAY